MARISAPIALTRAMREYFAAREMAEAVLFGASKLDQQLHQLPAPRRAGRVVIVPHDDSGKAGKLSPAKEIGQRPRQIYGLEHAIEIHCWGRDSEAQRSDEEAHYEAAFDLLELALGAVRDQFAGRVMFGDLRQETELKDARFGVALIQGLTIFGGVYGDDVAVVNPTVPGYSATMKFPPDGEDHSDGEVP